MCSEHNRQDTATDQADAIQKPPGYWPDEFSTVLRRELEAIRSRRKEYKGIEWVESESATESPPTLSENYCTARRLVRDNNLVGLAFSGGGIRVATVGLGFLQALAGFRLLKHFDYLSCVSGGGYIVSWLAVWIKRDGTLANVERQLNPSHECQAEADRLLKKGLVVDEEPEPIYHLRAYSNYLTPRVGLTSADSWTLIAIYLRNLFLNLLFVIPAVLGLVFLVRLVFCAYHSMAPLSVDSRLECILPWASVGWVGVVLAGFAIYASCHRLIRWISLILALLPLGLFSYHLEALDSSKNPTSLVATIALFVTGMVLFGLGLVVPNHLQRGPELLHGAPSHKGNVTPFNWFVVLCLLVSAATTTWLTAAPSDAEGDAWGTDWFSSFFPAFAQAGPAVTLGSLYALLGAVADSINLCLLPKLNGQPAPRHRWGRMFWDVFARFAAGAFFCITLQLLAGAERHFDFAPVTATFGPPLLLLAFVFANALETGLMGAWFEEGDREWWASITGYVLFWSTAWCVVFGLVYFGPLLVLTPIADGSLQTLLHSSLVLGWLATTVGGVMAGKNAGSESSGNGSRPLRLFATLAPWVFLIGLLILASLFCAWVLWFIEPEANRHNGANWFVNTFGQPTARSLWGAVAVCLIVALSTGLMVSVNLFSLHALYANRLIRCYLGASRPKSRWLGRDWTRTNRDRQGWLPLIRDWGPGRGGAPTAIPSDAEPPRRENYLTGFDSTDDLPMRDLRIGPARKGAEEDPQQPYVGPLLVVNTALNLVGGDELAWQERKAESFVINPYHCGSKSTGYARTDDADELTVGRAMAVSGAAASPNMGYHSYPPLTALMTIFNVRLGWWIQNPSRPNFRDKWTADSPKRWRRLLDEMLGKTNERGAYVYLSDGGHFENLGAYELVRRRCRYIVVCDSSADPEFAFEDLGNLIRRVRNDFGIRIDIDINRLRPLPNEHRSSWHCAIGTIRYEDVDQLDMPRI